jgi:hypothetical protein
VSNGFCRQWAPTAAARSSASAVQLPAIRMIGVSPAGRHLDVTDDQVEGRLGPELGDQGPAPADGLDGVAEPGQLGGHDRPDGRIVIGQEDAERAGHRQTLVRKVSVRSAAADPAWG